MTQREISVAPPSARQDATEPATTSGSSGTLQSQGSSVTILQAQTFPAPLPQAGQGLRPTLQRLIPPPQYEIYDRGGINE